MQSGSLDQIHMDNKIKKKKRKKENGNRFYPHLLCIILMYTFHFFSITTDLQLFV